MLIVLPYCKADAQQMLRLLRWIKALGGTEQFHALLVRDAEQDTPTRVAMVDAAKECFASVASIPVPIPAGTQWPMGCNMKWRAAAMHVLRAYKEPFFWVEPDCVPLRSTWAQDIAENYRTQPRKFMGPFVRQETQPALPKVSMPAVAVYSNDAITILGRFCGARQSLDMVAADEIIPRATETSLIQHFWGKAYDQPPTFENEGALLKLQMGAVLFHRCKDGSLINLLRRQAGLPEEEVPANGHGPVPAQEAAPIVEDGAEVAAPAMMSALVGVGAPEVSDDLKAAAPAVITRRGPGRPPKNGPALMSVFGGQKSLGKGEGRIATEG